MRIAFCWSSERESEKATLAANDTATMMTKKLKSPPIKNTAPTAVTIKQSPKLVSTSSPGRVSLELIQPGAKHVCVAGSFNGWKPEQGPLVSKGDGRWIGDLSVAPGRYEYLFVVDGRWLPDPNAKETVQNPYGGVNSVLTI